MQAQTIDFFNLVQQQATSNAPQLVDRERRIGRCRTLLQNLVFEAPQRNEPPEFVDLCRKWLTNFSLHSGSVPNEAIQKCEEVLEQKLGKLDEIDLRIIEMKSEFLGRVG